MRVFMIVFALVCALVLAPNTGFSFESHQTDLVITPKTNPNFFGGYVGGDGDFVGDPAGYIDWSIGNGQPYSGVITDDLVFSTNIGDFNNYDDWKERMRITKDGLVGIGTTSPYKKLTLNGTIGFSDGTTPLLMNSETCCTSGDRMLWAHSPGYDTWGIYYDDSGGDKMYWQQLPGSEIMTVDFGARKVGIGTTSPLADLHVEDSIRVGEDPNYPTVYGELIHSGGGTGFIINANAGGGGWADMHLQTNHTTKVFIESGGNVGLGSMTPTRHLEVWGGGTYMRTYEDTGESATLVCDRTSLGYSYSGATLGSDAYGVTGWHYGDGLAGFFNGNVYIAGALSKDSGSFVQPHAKDPSKEIEYAFFEGPEHAVFLRGTAQLKDGEAVIELPEHFRIVAAEEGVQVQVTPVEDCNGMFVANKSRERIDVKELMGGKHNAKFDYFITAVREGFEEHQPVTANTHFKPGEDESAREFEKRFSKDNMTTKAIRSMLISNGILTEDGKLDMAMVEKMGWTVAEKKSFPDRELITELVKQ